MPAWLLAGDAAGFLDPFTGEGLHRALVSAELAATAIHAHLGGEAGALAAYDRAAAFLGKDVVSWLVQAFLADRPCSSTAVASRASVRAIWVSSWATCFG